ncbi:hypothetical protein AB0I77_15910 [Streptomyces sp. NPDC050619]|uniref:hypothetical protein n=1 Tax=Streptomyces sp. NPDC050619 TaxID=3157214 RepID=UPI00343EBC41
MVRRSDNTRFHLKTAPSPGAFTRERTAYRPWTHALGWHAPSLVAADASLQTIVVTALPGRSLHGATLPPATEVRVHRGLGELTAAFHHGAPRTRSLASSSA